MASAGLRERHSRTCRSTSGSRCNCEPSIEAFVFDRRSHKKLRRTFSGKGARTAAKAWRADASVALRRGTLRAPAPTTVTQAWSAWQEGARAGTIRNRGGETFKPATLRAYETAMRLRVLDDFGAVRLADVRRVDLQDLVDRLLAEGADPSTVRNTLMPLRAIFRRAVARGELAVNPTRELELPAVTGKRDRIASATEASELLTALEDDRALWATAFYAGLRRGELRGLKWEDVDFGAGVIRVVRGWDDREGEIAPKSKSGRREVPIVAALRTELMAHRLRSGRAHGFVFGRSATDVFVPWTVDNRAARAWTAENDRLQKAEQPLLEPITLHEARHTFASILIAAGVNVKALSSYMGHASITITLDRYGHLMPGHEAEAVERVDSYLERATGAQRGAQGAGS